MTALVLCLPQLQHNRDLQSPQAIITPPPLQRPQARESFWLDSEADMTQAAAAAHASKSNAFFNMISSFFDIGLMEEIRSSYAHFLCFWHESQLKYNL